MQEEYKHRMDEYARRQQQIKMHNDQYKRLIQEWDDGKGTRKLTYNNEGLLLEQL
jgi:hypothetical protein